jgi:hypothetical protein
MQVQRDLERYREDALYFEAHREQLLVEHPEQWVAIYRNQVVGSAEELPELLSRLDEQGIPRGRSFIEYVSSKDDILILSASTTSRTH